jgi:hypothetical protein
LLARPCLRKWLTLATSPGSRALFAAGDVPRCAVRVVGNTLYRIDKDETVTTIGTLTTSTGYVSMAATDTYLFVADGAASNTTPTTITRAAP